MRCNLNIIKDSFSAHLRNQFLRSTPLHPSCQRIDALFYIRSLLALNGDVQHDHCIPACTICLHLSHIRGSSSVESSHICTLAGPGMYYYDFPTITKKLFKFDAMKPYNYMLIRHRRYPAHYHHLWAGDPLLCLLAEALHSDQTAYF